MEVRYIKWLARKLTTKNEVAIHRAINNYIFRTKGELQDVWI